MAYKVDGLLGGSADRMSPEEEQRLLMEIYGQPMPGGVGQQMPTSAQMPAPAQMPAYQPQMPTYQNFAPADAYGSQFERSLAFQSALPSMIPSFNASSLPPIYPQVAVDPYRLDIRNIELPDWLKAAIARGTDGSSNNVAPDTSSAYTRSTDIEH